MSKLDLFIIIVILSILQASCSGNPSGETDERDERDIVPLVLSIEPEVLRTYVGEDQVLFETQINGLPNNPPNLKWSVTPSDIATIDSLGNVEVHDLGSAQVIANLYDKDENIVSADTAHIYSEAVLALQTEKGIFSISTQSEEKGFFAGGGGNTNLYISMNGRNWSSSTAIPPQYTVTKIVRSVLDHNLLLLAYYDSEASVIDETSTGLLISKNNGESWTEIQHPFNKIEEEYFYWFSELNIANDNSEILFALTKVYTDSGGTRLYKSENQGSSWVIVKTFNHDQSSLHLHPSNANYLYISTHVYPEIGLISKNQGDTWASLEKENERVHVYDINTEGVIYGVLSTGAYDSKYLVHSKDDGDSWQVFFEESQYDLVDVDYFDPDIIAVLVRNNTNSGHLIRYSLDNGNSWNEHNLSFNDSKTSSYPDYIKILNFDSESIDILSGWNNLHLERGPAQIWNLKIFHAL